MTGEQFTILLRPGLITIIVFLKLLTVAMIIFLNLLDILMVVLLKLKLQAVLFNFLVVRSILNGI